MRFSRFLLAATLVLGPTAAEAASIRVIDDGVSGNVGVASAVSQLVALGHSVATGGTLNDYSAYDQVWDLRYNAALGEGDHLAFQSYLAGGGRLYLTGENPTFDALRNLSLQAALAAIGAGNVDYLPGLASNSQSFSAEGSALLSPNNFGSMTYLGARLVGNAGHGFLVSESAGGGGSMVAWDFGDLVGAATARMIVGWDIDIFRSNVMGAAWTANMAEFLGAAPPPAAVPEPATLALTSVGLLLAARQRRRAIRKQREM